MGKRRRGKTSPGAIERAEKQREAFQLRKRGFTVAQIGNRVGVHPSTVCDWIRKGLEEEVKGSREEFAAVNFAQLDELQEANSSKALDGDQAAAAIVFRCIQEKNKMLGIREGGGNTIVIGNTDGKVEGQGIEVRFIGVDPAKVAQDEAEWQHQAALRRAAGDPDSEPYSARTYEFKGPRLIEDKHELPNNSTPALTVDRPSTSEPPLNQHQIYERSFMPKEPGPNEARTELDLPQPDPPKKRRGYFSPTVLAGQHSPDASPGLKWGGRWNGPLPARRRDE